MKGNIITKIAKSPKYKNYVEIYINDKLFATVHIDSVVEHNLYKGKTLRSIELENVKSNAIDPRIYERVKRWLSLRPRSIQEFLQYAQYKLQLRQNQIEEILNTLKSKNLLNDDNFADWYVKNRVEHKLIGRRKIMFELKNKGVSNQIINKALNKNYQTEKEIEKIMTYLQKNKHSNNETLKMKLINLGFDYKNIRDALKISKN
ncbi:MAG: hypothetical protein KatS3mg085_110 [Candidatus Dojkabacteria bacterium]|nr:MAG: hypothetical protein KatS3mg085_110 [Candidatus Dojkabacteria bacterium]